MNPTPKSQIVIAPVSTTNAATATGSWDTLGYDFAVLDVMTTTSNAVTNNLSVLKLEEGDTTSSYSAVKTGDTDFTIAAADTDNPQVVAQFRVDLRARKRHLKVSASPVTTQTIWAHAQMYQADELPVSAAKANAGVVVDA